MTKYVSHFDNSIQFQRRILIRYFGVKTSSSSCVNHIEPVFKNSPFLACQGDNTRHTLHSFIYFQTTVPGSWAITRPVKGFKTNNSMKIRRSLIYYDLQLREDPTENPRICYYLRI